MFVPFNQPCLVGREEFHVLATLRSKRQSGGGPYGRRCEEWFENHLTCRRALLTPSCTHALELAALLIGIEPGDEVIMPSYTFVSSANAFVLRGATIVFVDVRPETMNMDERLIEAAITERTRAIVPVHYAGVACGMDGLLEIAERHRLYVVEDAAQGFKATWHGRPLGALGHLAAFSFHETKNVTSGGEGGLLAINDDRFVERAEIIREKGTNRCHFFRGMVDKYTWVDLGSSYLPSELQAAYLFGQLEAAETITADRLATWQRYYERLLPLAERGLIELPVIPEGSGHNGHLFFVKVQDIGTRGALIEHLAREEVNTVFHYVPLHSSPAGRRFSRFHGEDRYTTRDSERLLRLPLWYGIGREAADQVAAKVAGFFQ